MGSSPNEKLIDYSEIIKKETYGSNNGFVKLSDVNLEPLGDDAKTKVAELLEKVKLPNGYIDFNALVYDLNVILNDPEPVAFEEKHDHE